MGAVRVQSQTSPSTGPANAHADTTSLASVWLSFALNPPALLGGCSSMLTKCDPSDLPGGKSSDVSQARKVNMLVSRMDRARSHPSYIPSLVSRI